MRFHPWDDVKFRRFSAERGLELELAVERQLEQLVDDNQAERSAGGETNMADLVKLVGSLTNELETRIERAIPTIDHGSRAEQLHKLLELEETLAQLTLVAGLEGWNEGELNATDEVRKARRVQYTLRARLV